MQTTDAKSRLVRKIGKVPAGTNLITGNPVNRALASAQQDNRCKLHNMSGFIQRFAWFSASGFLLSLVVHIIGLLNKAPFFVWFAIPLHFGVFVALFGVVVAFFRLRQSEGKGFWRRALRASPAWMMWVLLVFLIYSLANFLVFWNTLFNLNGKPLDEVKVIILRGFSGHWMVFYFGTFLVFYAAMQVTQRSGTSKA